MANYKMKVMYDGSRYNGWQKQGNTKNTIQAAIEKVIGRLLDEEIEIYGSGRTDAGAHAKGQIANFHTKKDININLLCAEINKYLPTDIAVTSLERVNDRFHSRLNAKRKTYVYRIWNSGISNVFERDYMYTSAEKANLDEMRKAAAYLIGSHDFKSFCSNKRYKKSTLREIYSIDIEKIGDEIRITFCGNGFLYNMVRIMAGTILQCGEGKLKPENIPHILDAQDREKAGVTLPAEGLTLLSVEY